MHLGVRIHWDDDDDDADDDDADADDDDDDHNEDEKLDSLTCCYPLCCR